MAGLTIENIESRGFKITVNDALWEDGLTQDEALWTVAQFLLGMPLRYLKTDAEHEARRMKYAAMAQQQSTEENECLP